MSKGVWRLILQNNVNWESLGRDDIFMGLTWTWKGSNINKHYRKKESKVFGVSFGYRVWEQWVKKDSGTKQMQQAILVLLDSPLI